MKAHINTDEQAKADSLATDQTTHDLVSRLRTELNDLRASSTAELLGALETIRKLQTEMPTKEQLAVTEEAGRALSAERDAFAAALASAQAEGEDLAKRLASAQAEGEDLAKRLASAQAEGEDLAKRLEARQDEAAAARSEQQTLHDERLSEVAATADRLRADMQAVETVLEEQLQRASRFEGAFQSERRRVVASAEALFAERERGKTIQAFADKLWNQIHEGGAVLAKHSFSADGAQSGALAQEWPQAAWKRLPLTWRSLTVAGDQGGPAPIRLATPAEAWRYGAISQVVPRRSPAVDEILAVTVLVDRPAGFALCDPQGDALLSTEQVPVASDAVETLYFDLPAKEDPACVVLRNPGDQGALGSVRIEDVRILSEADLDPQNDPRRGADHWEDFDGLFTLHALPGQPPAALPLTVATPAEAWSYAALSDVMDFEAPGFACVELIIIPRHGQIGLALVTDDAQALAGPGVVLVADLSPHVIYLRPEMPSGQGRLMARNHDDDGVAGEVEILKARLGFRSVEMGDPLSDDPIREDVGSESEAQSEETQK